MSKKANRFERSSGWTSRPGGGAEKKATGRPQRRDLSEGTRRMADGGNEPQAAEILAKERRGQQLRQARADENAARKARKLQLLRKFRQWRAAGELDATVRCPLCREVLPTVDFERHVKRTHCPPAERRYFRQDPSKQCDSIHKTRETGSNPSN